MKWIELGQCCFQWLALVGCKANISLCYYYC